MTSISAPTTSNETARFDILFVMGVARSGSTLLGKMLDMHPQVISVGEMMRLDTSSRNNIPCSCGEQLSNCAFWKDHLPHIKRTTGYQFTRYSPEHYEKIRLSAGKSVIVDLSKTRVWRMRRWWPTAFRWRHAGEGFIFLVRDPRGIAASSTRNGKDLGKFLMRYEKWARRIHKFVATKQDRGLIVHYEDLCRHPEKELGKICDFMSIPFDRRMLFPADKVHHFVSSSTSGYLKGSNTIRLDERWRQELSSGDLQRVESTMSRIPFLRDAYL